MATRTIKAEITGVIITLEKQVGDPVEADDIVLFMESMKMEMSLSAPAPVILKSVDCQVGQLVDMGKVLVELEPAPDAE